MSHSMNRCVKRFTSAVLPSLLLALLVSCGGGGDSTAPVDTAQPVFTSQPASQTVVAGTQITFAATATGNAPIAYQWQRNGVDIPGATGSQYSIVTQESDTSSVWTVKASNGTPSPATSQGAMLTVTPAAPGITLLAGDRNAAWPSGEFKDGTGASARFFRLTALTVDREGNVYVTDNETVRKITRNGVVTTVAGALFAPGNQDGPGPLARFAGPGESARYAGFGSIGTDANGNVYLLSGSAIRKIDRAGMVSTVTASVGIGPRNLVVDSFGSSYVSDLTSVFFVGSGVLHKVSPDGVSAPFSPGYRVFDNPLITDVPMSINTKDQIFSSSCLIGYRQQITRFDTQGNATLVADTEKVCWRDIAVDDKDGIYGAGFGNIAKFSPPGAWVLIAGSGNSVVGGTLLMPGSLGTEVRGMAFGPDSSLYVIANNSVVQIRLP